MPSPVIPTIAVAAVALCALLIVAGTTLYSKAQLKKIAGLTGADKFKAEPAVPYAKDGNTCIKEAKQSRQRAAGVAGIAVAADTVRRAVRRSYCKTAPRARIAFRNLDKT